MKLYQRVLRKSLDLIISSQFRHILLRIVGLNNYISLIMKSLDIRGNVLAKKKILCVERRYFEKDVDELSHRVRKYGWIWLKKSQLTAYQDQILPRKYIGQKKYHKYINDAPEIWAECISRSKILLKRLKEEQNVCALMIANINYWQDYALQIACKELKIPVIVLQKEYPYNNLDYYKSFKKYYTKDFNPSADALMVYGERAKNIYLETKTFDANKIFVTGPPRLDRWRSIENYKEKSGELLILPFRNDENKIEPFLDILVVISNFIKNKNLGRIIIKSRNKTQTIELRNFCNKQKIDNVTIIDFANIYDIVPQSKVIVGLTSMATIECMLSRVPIIIPDWIIRNKNKKLFDPNDENCFKSLEFSNNINDLLSRILTHLNDNNSQINDKTFEERRKFISRFWDHDPSTTACSKVQEVIDKLVN